MSKIFLGSWASAADDENIWFSNFNLNGLMRYEIKKKKVFFECFFQHMPIDVDLLHCCAYEDGNSIFFIPYDKTEYISVFDKEKHVVTDIRIPEKTIGSSVKIGRNIYLLTKKNEILLFDIDRMSFEMDNYLSSLVKRVFHDNPNIRINTSGDKFIFINTIDNHFIVIDLLDRKQREIILDDTYIDLLGVYYLNGKYWITRANTPNILSVGMDGVITELKYDNEDIEWLSELKITYSQIVSTGEMLILPGYYFNGIMILDIKKNKMFRLKFPDDYKVKFERGYGATYRNVHRINDKMYIIPQRANKLVVIDLIDNDIEYIDFSIELDELPEYREYYKEKMQKEIITEGTSDCSTIDFFIEVVSS